MPAPLLRVRASVRRKREATGLSLGAGGAGWRGQPRVRRQLRGEHAGLTPDKPGVLAVGVTLVVCAALLGGLGTWQVV